MEFFIGEEVNLLEIDTRITDKTEVILAHGRIVIMELVWKGGFPITWSARTGAW